MFGLILAILLALHMQESSSTQPSPAETLPPKEPRKTKHVAPEWPANALRAGLNGPVVLECVVGTDGRVEDVKVLKGYRSLSDAASAAVRKWRYTPTELDGKAVPVIMTVTVNFRLQKAPKRDDALASLSDSDPEIRWAAVKWLGRYRPVTAAQKAGLEAALQDASELVYNAAREALEKLDAK